MAGLALVRALTEGLKTRVVRVDDGGDGSDGRGEGEEGDNGELHGDEVSEIRRL